MWEQYMNNKSKKYEVVIIGGGVIGVSIAYKLSMNNIKCAIIEKNNLGHGATRAAAGVISPLFYGSDQIGSPMSKMRILSYEMFLNLENEFEELEIESPYKKTGIFRTAFDESELQLLKNLSETTKKFGVKSELIDDLNLRNELNFINEEITSGMFFPDEGYVDGLDFVTKLKFAITKMGSDVFENEEFIDFNIENENINKLTTSQQTIFTENLIFATGSENILSKFDLPKELNIYPVKGQYILVRAKDFNLPYTIGDGTYGQIENGPGYQGYLVPRDDNMIYIGASKHHGKNDKSIELEGVDFCLKIAKKYLRSIENLEFISTNSGIRPQSKSGNPIIKKIFNKENIFFVSGHFAQGMMLSLGTAEIIKNYLNKSDVTLFEEFNQM